MAEGDNRSTNLLAAETAGLEEQLQGWGEVILVTDKILRWEKSWFPAAMLSVVSMIFLLVYVALSVSVQIKMVMDYNAFKRISGYRGYQLLQFSPSFFDRLIYYVDPSVLSGVSCFVMLLCLADYLVPALAPRIFGSSKWTTEQQQRFHEICSNLVKTRRKIVGWWKRLFTFKEEKPKMYFTTMVCLLAVIAWIGQQVHNLFLTYLIVCFVLLFPGLNKHGVISKYAGMAKREVNKLLKHKEKKNE